MSGFRVYLLAKTGVYSSAPATGQAPEGFGAIVLYALLGAFSGIIAGFVAGQLLRYVAFLMGRSASLHVFALGGALLGAILFVAWAVSNDSN